MPQDVSRRGFLTGLGAGGATMALAPHAAGGAESAPGSSGAVLIYENRWAAPFTTALRNGGAQLVAAGFIPQDDLLASLEANEPSNN